MASASVSIGQQVVVSYLTNLQTINGSGYSSGTVVQLKTNDVTVAVLQNLDLWAGTNVSIIATNRGSGHADVLISATSGGGSQTPITQDVNYAGFNATNMGELFATNMQIAPSGPGTYNFEVDSDGNVNANGTIATGSTITGGDINATGVFHGNGSGITNISGGSQTPITQDVDYAGFSATNLGLLVVGPPGIGCSVQADGSLAIGTAGGFDASGNITGNSLSINSSTTALNSDGSASFGALSFLIGSDGGLTNQVGASFAAGNVLINYDGSASFAGGAMSIAGDGKITATGVVDPPMYLLDCISKDEALQLYADQVPVSKRTGLALYFDGRHLMAFRGSTLEMWEVQMKPAGTFKLPNPKPHPPKVHTKPTTRTNTVHKPHP